MPRAPIEPARMTPHGAYGAYRASPADGSCGVRAHPCTHRGADVRGPQGTPVHAPAAGTVVVVADGESVPWRGYGPAVVVLRDHGGAHHVLAHLEPSSVDVEEGDAVEEGDEVGETSAANHVHWEVRAGGLHGERRDPGAWLARGGSLRTSTGGVTWLLVLAAYWMLSSKRDRRR